MFVRSYARSSIIHTIMSLGWKAKSDNLGEWKRFASGYKVFNLPRNHRYKTSPFVFREYFLRFPSFYSRSLRDFFSFSKNLRENVFQVYCALMLINGKRIKFRRIIYRGMKKRNLLAHARGWVQERGKKSINFSSLHQSVLSPIERRRFKRIS